MVALSAVDCLAAAFFDRHPGVQRHRVALDSPGVLGVPRLPGLSGPQAIASRSCAVARLGLGAGRRFLRGLPVPVLSRAGWPSWSAHHARPGRVGGRHHSLAGSHAPGPRPADGDRRDGVSCLYLRRSLHARPHRPQGRVDLARHVAPMAHHRRRVRRRAGRVERLHLPVRAFRLAARQGGGRQLFHQVGVRSARPHARRAGQGCSGVVGRDRRDLGLVDRQCGDHRHLHHPAHEAGRLPAPTRPARWRCRVRSTAS